MKWLLHKKHKTKLFMVMSILSVFLVGCIVNASGLKKDTELSFIGIGTVFEIKNVDENQVSYRINYQGEDFWVTTNNLSLKIDDSVVVKFIFSHPFNNHSEYKIIGFSLLGLFKQVQ